jgi:hypothetical protein
MLYVLINRLKEEMDKRAMAFIKESVEDFEHLDNDDYLNHNHQSDIIGRNPSSYKNKSLKLNNKRENGDAVLEHSKNPLSSVIPIEPPSQIVLSTIKRDLARHRKFKFNGAYNVPLNAAVTSLQIITQTGRRMKAVSTTSLGQLQLQHDNREERKRAITEERAANINKQNNTTYTYPSIKPDKRDIKHIPSRLQDNSLVSSSTGTELIDGAESYDDSDEHLNHMQLQSQVKQRPKSSSSNLMRPRKCNEINTVIKPLDLLSKTKLSYRDVIGK